MTDQPPIADPSARLTTARADFAALRGPVRAGEPWPLAERFGTEPEASWGPREVLAHTSEMLPFWLGEYERVLEAGRGPADPQPFGRTADDELRVRIIERDRALPLRELFDRIDAGIDRWQRRLAAASTGDATPPGAGSDPTAPPADAPTGLHPRLGPMSADDIRDRFVITHLEDHLAQLGEILRERH